MKRIAWGVTGGGHYLAECLESMHELSKRNKISTFVTRAGEEVLHMYGLFDELEEISKGGYLEELFLEREQGSSFPKAGRFMLGKYDMLIVAPATSNTVAKMAWGIADTLVTNAAALANKSRVPVYVLPTDLEEEAESRMPYAIDREICIRCEPCRPGEECPRGAIEDGQIDLMLCDGCGTCAELCGYRAISGGLVHVEARGLDVQNIERLRGLPDFYVLKGVKDIGGLETSQPVA